MIINTLHNTMSYGRRIIPGLEEPVPLSTMLNHISLSERTQETIDELHHTILLVFSEDRMDITKGWKSIKATVCVNYEILDLVTDPVLIRFQDAPVGGHVYLEGSSNTERLTISSVREGQVTVALVVNITGNPIKIKHGLKLGDCLLYDRKVVTNPLEFPLA